MRYRAALLGIVLVAAGCGGGGGKMTTSGAPPQRVSAAKLKVVVKGPTRTPKANANWPYRVTATDRARKRLSGKLTVQIVDPLGNAHAVTYDNTKKPVRNFPFHGTFHDYLQFPKDSVGYLLTVRAKVTSSQASGTGRFGVKPRQ